MMIERGLRREIPSLSPGLLQIAFLIKTSLWRTLFIGKSNAVNVY